MDQYVVKEPGRLPTGFGREAEHNMFHGGTIFRDACSKENHKESGVVGSWRNHLGYCVFGLNQIIDFRTLFSTTK